MSFYDKTEVKRILDLEAEITRLSANIYAAEYRWLCLLAQFDELEGWCGDGIKSFAHWPNWKCGISLAAGREKVRVARRLGELPLVSKAMSEGRLSYSKVRAITRIATAENEQDLLYIARNGTAEQLEKTIQLYRKSKAGVDSNLDSSHANQQHEMKYLTYYYDTDGSLIINGRMPAEQGAQLVKALEAGTDFIFTEQRRVCAEARPESDVGKEPELQASDVSAETSRPSLTSIRVDALCTMAEKWLACESTTVCNSDRYQVVVHVDEEVLQGSTQGCGKIAGGPFIAPETVRRLACDSSLIRVTEDALGNILDIGRKTRSIPSAIKRALRIRDQGCQFPGCTTDHRFCDGHHVQPWIQGGSTSLGNLVLLCRRHHRLVHEGGYMVEASHWGKFIFHRPDGRELESSPGGSLPDPREAISESTSLPLDRPQPKIIFPGKLFCLTGKFVSGTRGECESYIVIHGGKVHSRPTIQTDYLVIGNLGSRDWIHSSYGLKIEKAVHYKEKYSKISIVSEDHWSKFITKAA